MYLVIHNISYLLFQTSRQGHVYIYGAEYQTDSKSPISNANDHNVACALCTTYDHTTKITIHLITSANWMGERILQLSHGWILW